MLALKHKPSHRHQVFPCTVFMMLGKMLWIFIKSIQDL